MVPAGVAYADPLVLTEERLQPGVYPAAPMPDDFVVPPEPGHPPFEIDWSIGLKGSYTSATTGDSFVTTLNPAFTATHEGVRTDLVIDGSAEIAKPWDGTEAAITGLAIGVESTTALDRDTNVSASADLQLTQDLPTLPRLDPLISAPPQVLSGSVGVGIDRQFGKFNVDVSGYLNRTLYGPTTRTDTGVTENTDQNVWEGDAALRLGFAVSPIIEVFGEASVSRDWFDTAAAGSIKPDATGTALRAGISGEWNGILAASASFGVGHHDFDAAALGDVSTYLYDASVTFTPDDTLSLAASLSTSVEPVGADRNGSARVDHLAAADINYTVNSWLRLRATAEWGLSLTEGTDETEWSHGYGAGADYAVNKHTALSADYAYSHRDNNALGTLDAHTVSVGVTLQR
jgi:hypothetical protein